MKVPKDLLDLHETCLGIFKWPKNQGRGLLNFYAYYDTKTIDDVIDVIKRESIENIVNNIPLLGKVTLVYIILALMNRGYSGNYWIFKKDISEYTNTKTWKYLIRRADLNDSTIKENMYDVMRLRANPSINSIEVLRIMFLKWIVISLNDLIIPWRRIREQRKK